MRLALTAAAILSLLACDRKSSQPAQPSRPVDKKQPEVSPAEVCDAAKKAIKARDWKKLWDCYDPSSAEVYVYRFFGYAWVSASIKDKEARTAELKALVKKHGGDETCDYGGTEEQMKSKKDALLKNVGDRYAFWLALIAFALKYVGNDVSLFAEYETDFADRVVDVKTNGDQAAGRMARVRDTIVNFIKCDGAWKIVSRY